MKTLKINPKNYTKNQIDEIVDYLNRGKVIIYPTDTIYGIGCLATDKKAVKKVYKIKKRDENKPFIKLMKSWCMVKKYCFVNKKQEEYLRKIWPGPVTVILNKKAEASTLFGIGKSTIAVRLPKNDFLTTILKKVNVPLVSSSANVEGQETVNNPLDAEKQFKDLKPDLFIDAGILKRRKSSKLIDLREVGDIKVLRK